MNLFLVESPAKIKTIKKFLGRDFVIRATMGHIREIPKKGLGIDVHNGFKAQFELIESKSDNTRDVLKLMSEAELVYFAQDLDREGELIAWHLFDQSGLDSDKVRRVVFNEITEKAVLSAVASPRELDFNLIYAGMCRTVLDRLIGYKLSPLIWKRFDSSVPLSIGRVQTVALRILVDRDREIEAFVKEEFWNIRADFKEGFLADIYLKQGEKLDKFKADELLERMKGKNGVVTRVEKKEELRRPFPPFTTATLQQEASTRLKFSAKETMQIAQELYEGVEINGENKALITYMRTDAVNLSDDAIKAIRGYIHSTWGKEYLTPKPLHYKSKSKNAQEAHEAIRPSYFSLPPDKVQPWLKPKHFELYKLIWDKTIACQMASAVYDATNVRIEIAGVEFRVKGSIQRFDGYQKAYADIGDSDKSAKKEEKDVWLPPLHENQILIVNKLIPEKKFTKPPARYTEASLVKFLEKHGIGRPSTYATILETLIRRTYVVLNQRKFETTDLGKKVCDWTRKNFESVVDIEFTARVEDSLDEIAKGKHDWLQVISEYYQPLREKIISIQGFVEEDLDSKNLKCPLCNKELQVRSGKHGQFLGCSGFPECTYIHKTQKNFQKNTAVDSFEAITTGIYCNLCGAEFHLKESAYGKYFACSGWPQCKNKRTKLTQEEVNIYKQHRKVSGKVVS